MQCSLPRGIVVNYPSTIPSRGIQHRVVRWKSPVVSRNLSAQSSGPKSKPSKDCVLPDPCCGQSDWRYTHTFREMSRKGRQAPGQCCRVLFSALRVSGYRSRGPGFDFLLYQIFREVVGIEWSPLSLVKVIYELFEWKRSGSGPEIRN
jgi:hypothetical protein